MRVLPEHWLLSVACAPLAVLVGGPALGWSPGVGALVLTAPALVMALGSAGAPVVASYLLGVLAASASLLHSGLPIGATPESMLTWPTLLAVAVAAVVTLGSQLVLGDGVKSWTAATALALVGAGGLLSFHLLGGPRALDASPGAPEMLLSVPACTTACEMQPTPSGHLRCSNVTKSDHAVALRECDNPSSFVHVHSAGQQTSVLVLRDEPAVIWREASGKLVVAQAGVPVRALSPKGAVLLSSSFTTWSQRQPAHLLRLAGASLLLVGAALLLVLRSHREQRMLAAGLAGHVEAGRFFARDRQISPVQVAGPWRNGPALLFGKARPASYRDGGGEPMRVVSGTGSELAAQHATRRLGAWASALAVVLFAMVSVAADLARLQ